MSEDRVSIAASSGTTTGTVVSAHQPNFAPWLGFLDKLVASDVMVLLDTVQFAKRSYQNRTRVKGPGGPQWLTVPVITKGRYDQRTIDVEIDESRDWRTTHPRTLYGLYAKAPHRAEVLELVEPIYANEKLTTLAEFTTALLRAVVDRLGITTRLVAASELDVQGASSRLMLNCTVAAGGTVYLSGPTGRDYLEPPMFEEAGVQLHYHTFRPFEYPQQFGEFAPGLSCLDYLANVGFRPWWEPR
ncbi:MAG: WbqC family protein [Pseudonocardia sp.]